MSIHINLSPEMENYIQGKVRGGFYGNATEVIRDAIRRMQVDEDRAAAFRRAVAAGEAELSQGLGTELTPARLEEISERARRKVGRGEPIDPDVVP